MTELTGSEMRQTETLTEEGYRVYRHVLSDLKSADNPKVTRAARIGALLFARHADIYAAAMRKRGAEYADYTAMDYYEKAFALDISGRNARDGERLHQAAMYRHPAKTFSEFMEKVLNGEAGKSYYDMPLDNTLLRIYSDDVKHIQTGVHKHPLSMEEWDVLLRHLNNVDEAWRTKDTKKPRGMAVVVMFKTKGKSYGAVLEFSETGIVFLKTAVAGSEGKVDGTLKINKREAGMRLHTGLPGRTAEAGDSHAAFTSHSLSLSSIQHILGIGNTPISQFEQSAWHGSPYTFDRFDLGAIGTGAGAQAHGWGLYFAKNQEAAEGYKNDNGGLYEADIPDDDVLLDEQKPFTEQPPKVKKGLWELIEHLSIEQLENWDNVRRIGKAKVIAKIKQSLAESDGMNIYGSLVDLVEGYKEASLLLNKYGIKGITYEESNAGRGFVIFDDKAISIIERYNQEAANAQRAAERLKEDAKAWKETLKEAWAGKMSETQMFRVMETPLVLQLVGAKALPIYMAQKKLMQVKKEHPELNKTILNKLPEQLADPMMIFQSETVPGRIVVCLELKDEAGANIVVPVELNAKNDRMEINILASIYGKGNPSKGSNYSWFLNNVLNGNALYINKKQAENLYRAAGLQLPMEGRKFNDLFGSSIKTDADLVKEKMKNPALYQETHGETTMMQNGRRIVSLFASADESTFLHELGHVFLDDLRQLAAFDERSQKELATVDEWAAWHEGAAKEYQNTPWEKEFKAHEAAILAAKKSGDAKALEKALAVWRHERFARAFERYLKEGEAPARGLKQVFRKFAAFLRSIYQAFTSDGGRASEAVERVMDRMIAADEEIEAAAQDKRYRDFTKAGGEKLLRESDKATYQRWHEKAKAEAKERLRKVITKKLERERKAQLSAEIESEEERFRAKLYEDPIYQAREAVKMAKDENAALLFYPTVEEYQSAAKRAPEMETLIKEHMEDYRRTREKALLENAITPDEVEKAMAGTEYHARLMAYEAKAFAKQADALRRISGKAQAAMDEVEEKIEEMPEGTAKEDAVEAQKEAVRQKYQGTDMWMKAPNGQPTKLTEEQWLFVRTPAFKAQFGDWEEVARYTIPRKAENFAQAVNAAKAFVGKEIRNQILSISAIISNKNIAKMVSRSATKKSVHEKIHALAVANVDKIFENAMVEYTHQDRNEDKNIKQIHRMFSPFVANGHVFVAKLTVKELASAKEGNRVYTIEALETEEASRIWNAAYNTEKELLTSFPQEAFKESITKTIEKINAFSKGLDENGEPLLSGDKKAAVRDFKKRISGSKEVLYCEGLSGHSRPSAGTWASTLNAKLHPSGNFSIAEDGGKSKEAGKSEKKTDAAKEKYSARDLYRAIHRLRSAHRWGAEELSAIDALGKAASKADLKAAWEKAKELLTTEHLAEQELKEALRGQSQLYRELARKEIADMTITEASAIMTFRRQEKESAARVERLIKAENWAAAEKEKQKQMMAAALVAGGTSVGRYNGRYTTHPLQHGDKNGIRSRSAAKICIPRKACSAKRSRLLEAAPFD